jgi:hypothetical protein
VALAAILQCGCIRMENYCPGKKIFTPLKVKIILSDNYVTLYSRDYIIVSYKQKIAGRIALKIALTASLKWQVPYGLPLRRH